MDTLSRLSAGSESVIRSKLTNFHTAHSNQLTSSPNSDVVRASDVLYVLSPLSQAVCAEDEASTPAFLKWISIDRHHTLLSTSGPAGPSPPNDLWVPITSGNRVVTSK